VTDQCTGYTQDDDFVAVTEDGTRVCCLVDTALAASSWIRLSHATAYRNWQSTV